MKFMPIITSYSGRCYTKKNLKNDTASVHIFNRTIDLVGFDFGKAEEAVVTFWVTSIKLNNSWNFSERKAYRTMLPTSLSFFDNRMTKKEIEIQIALGTLSYKKYMEAKGILYENGWWYFLIPKHLKCKASKTLIINNQEHYPVAGGYIYDVSHSSAHNGYTEERLADEIISQCYSCMSLERADH